MSNYERYFITFRAIFLFAILTIIPITITSLFAYLTYRSINSIKILVNQQIDRQMIRMTLFQIVLVNIFFKFPYGGITTYKYITGNETKDDTSRIMHEQLVFSLCDMLLVS